MEWLKEEFQAVWYVVVGIVMLGIGAFLSDIVTKTTDKLWKKD